MAVPGSIILVDGNTYPTPVAGAHIIYPDPVDGGFGIMDGSGNATRLMARVDAATESQNGLLTAADKTKLDGLGAIYKNADFNVVVNTTYAIDTSSTLINATLPSTPASGRYVRLFDCTNSFVTNKCSILLSGNQLVVTTPLGNNVVSTAFNLNASPMDIMLWFDGTYWRLVR